MKRFVIPRGNRDSVKRVLFDVLKAEEENTVYDPSNSLSRRGRKSLIEGGTDEAHIIYKLAAANMSHAYIAAAVNRFRSSRSPPKPTVSWNAVQAFISSSPLIVRILRQSNKSGSNDENFTWALARCAQREQMLELGKLPCDCLEVTDSDIPSLRLHGVVFWDDDDDDDDEHHKKK